MNVPTGQYCPPSIGMVAAFKLESLAGIVGIRSRNTVDDFHQAGDSPCGFYDGVLVGLAR